MARNFDGSSTYLSIADDAALTLLDGNWCLAGWINTDELPGSGFQYFYSHGAFAATSSCNMFIQESSGQVTVAAKSDDAVFKYLSHASSAITAGGWHHILLHNVGDDLRLYTNGTQRANDNTAWGGINPSGAMLIGKLTGATSYLDGHVAEWAKWDAVLSDEQIAALVAGVRPTEVGTRPAWYMPMLAGLDEEIAGLAATNYGTTISEHPPAIIRPGIPHVLRPIWPRIGGPYQVLAAGTHASGAADGQIFSAGTAIGQVNEQ